MTDETYDVGYGKPPKAKQFQKGKSGNPKGRKPKTQNMSTLLKAEFSKLIVVSEGGQQKTMTKREAFVASMVNDAITGKKQGRADILKILNVTAPAEPFEVTDDDKAELDLFVSRQLKIRKEDDSGDDS